MTIRSLGMDRAMRAWIRIMRVGAIRCGYGVVVVWLLCGCDVAVAWMYCGCGVVVVRVIFVVKKQYREVNIQIVEKLRKKWEKIGKNWLSLNHWGNPLSSTNTTLVVVWLCYDVVVVVVWLWCGCGVVVLWLWCCCGADVVPVASPRGEWVGPDPPLLFRPLLRLAQIRWKFCYIIPLSSDYWISRKKTLLLTSSGQAQVLRPASSFQHYWLKLIKLDEL